MRRLGGAPLPLVVLEPADSGVLYAYYDENAEHLAPWEPLRDPSFYTSEGVRQVVADRYRAYLDGRSLHLSALGEDGAMVAECNFTNIVRGPLQACTLGFSVAKAKEGQGIMTTVVQRATDIVFSEYGLHRVMANFMPRNTASARVLQKCGFVREGLARQYLRIAGRWEDHVLTALVNPAPVDD